MKGRGEIAYDIIVQIGCNPAHIHKAPYFIYTDSGIPRDCDLSVLDAEPLPRWSFSVGQNGEVYRHATGIMTYSPLSRHSLICHHGVAPEKVSCIGCSSSVYPSSIRREHGKKAINDFIWIGTDYENKGTGEVILAAKRLNDAGYNVALSLVGIDSIPISPVPDYVRVIPYIKDRGDIARLFEEAGAFIMPSYRETFGIVYIEAMSCGLPVIATTRGGMAEIVRASKSGLVVPPGDITAIQSAMMSLIDDPAGAAEMGQRGYELCRNNFTGEILGSRISYSINQWLNGGDPPADQLIYI